MVKNPVKQETQEMSLIPGSGRHSREENSNPLQYFCLENPMEREAWWATVHRVTNVSDMTQMTKHNKGVIRSHTAS